MISYYNILSATYDLNQPLFLFDSLADLARIVGAWVGARVDGEGVGTRVDGEGVGTAVVGAPVVGEEVGYHEEEGINISE